jgi:hypothetical protein
LRVVPSGTPNLITPKILLATFSGPAAVGSFAGVEGASYTAPEEASRMTKRATLSLGLVCACLVCILTGAAQYESLFGTPASLQPPERLPYYYAPPKSVTVELGPAKLMVDLRHMGPLNIASSIPLSGGSTHYDVIDNLCINWQLYGVWPNATMYQVRPTPLTGAAEWSTFVLHISVPSMTWGATNAQVYLLENKYFQSIPATANLHAIQPTPSVLIGPMGMQGTPGYPTAYQADITFPAVTLEWFRETREARLRAGNVVLHSAFGHYWNPSKLNTLQIGSFMIDLPSGRVSYYEGSQVLQTALTAVVDDSPDSVMIIAPFFAPEIWE